MSSTGGVYGSGSGGGPARDDEAIADPETELRARIDGLKLQVENLTHSKAGLQRQIEQLAAQRASDSNIIAAQGARIQELLDHTSELTNAKREANAKAETLLEALLATANVAGKLAAMFNKS